jgi:hypothetical protein
MHVPWWGKLTAALVVVLIALALIAVRIGGDVPHAIFTALATVIALSFAL